ncbi:MAG: hypothetical protein COC05_06685 [Gammaproteobacteria bacterium]|nr:MAG: hypothetical protein COC05_06685 [Gammaproteobacteria bacterium]
MNTTATNEQSPIDNKKALRRAVIELIANGRHQLFILAYDLDPLIYSNDDFTQQLSALARRSKRPDIHILLHRPTRLLIKRKSSSPGRDTTA